MKRLFFSFFSLLALLLGSLPTYAAVENWQLWLEDQGYKPTIAAKIIATNADWWPLLDADGERQLQQGLRELRYYGRDDLIGDHPELLGLLAASNDPEKILRYLPEDCVDHLLNYYLLFATTRNAVDDVAEVLSRHDYLLCRYSKLGEVQVYILLDFIPENQHDFAYESWLSETLQQALQGSDEQRLQTVAFLLAEAPIIRQKMAEDYDFKSNFLSHWHFLLQHIDWEIKPENDAESRRIQPSLLDASVPHLWDYLALPRGKSLYRTYGIAPIPLFFGDAAYSSSLHEKVSTLLLSGDKALIYAANYFIYNNDFKRLLSRSIDDSLLHRGILQLLAACQNQANYCQTLNTWANMSDLALRRTISPQKAPFGVPPGIWIVWQKVEDGRPITAWNMLSAALDVASVVPVGGGAAASLKLVANTAGAKAAQGAAKQFVIQKSVQSLQGRALSVLKIDIAPLLRQVQLHKTPFKHIDNGYRKFFGERLGQLPPANLYMRKDALVIVDTKPLLKEIWKRKGETQEKRSAPDFIAFDSNYLASDAIEKTEQAQQRHFLQMNRSLPLWQLYLAR